MSTKMAGTTGTVRSNAFGRNSSVARASSSSGVNSAGLSKLRPNSNACPPAANSMASRGEKTGRTYASAARAQIGGAKISMTPAGTSYSFSRSRGHNRSSFGNRTQGTAEMTNSECIRNGGSFFEKKKDSSLLVCRAEGLQLLDYTQSFNVDEVATLAEGYAKSSYYTALGLFLFSLPGLWSLIKRSTKSKIVKKTYEIPGPAVPGAVELDDTARSIARYFKEKNYDMQTAGQKVIFEGKYEPNFGQASYITFCSFLGLGSFALVLSIVQQDVGNYWYLMTLLSPMAGYYYWSKSGRTEKIEVKMITSDNDEVTDIIVQGDDEEVERFRQELDFMEKGKIYVKGLLEQ